MNDPIQDIIQNQPLILAAEIGVLLHDLGKLSEEFVDQMSVDLTAAASDRYNHTSILKNQWLKDHPNFVPPSLVDALKDTFWKEKLSIPLKGAAQTDSLETLVTHHQNQNNQVTLVRALVNCDRADSGVDKAIQSVRAKQFRNRTYIATVFGYERRGHPIDLGLLQIIRDKVCQKLAKDLQAYQQCQMDIVRLRENVLDALLPIDGEGGFHTTLGETRRAANDVTLADHSFSVASIFKAELAEILIKKEIPDPKFPIHWKLLGIKWDGLEIIGKAFRVNDVLGRREMIRQVKETLRCFIELEFPIGNKIYDDEDGIYFTIPNLDYRGCHASVANYLRDQIAKKVNIASDGEINPSILLFNQETRSLVHLTWLIKNQEPNGTKSLLDDPSQESIRTINLLKDQSFEPNWVKLWDSPQADICPVCRSKHHNIQGKENRPFDICPVCQVRPKREGLETCDFCQHWREEGSRVRDREEGSKIKNREGTHWIDLVADDNNQVAIITGRFWLESWLHGEQTDTLFSQSLADWNKGPYQDLIKRMEQAFQGTDTSVLDEVGGDAWNNPRYKGQVKNDPTNDANVVEEFYNAAVTERDVRELCKEAHTSHERAQWLAHFLFRKHPSPARLRRVWRTTLKFSESISNDLNELLEQRTTWRFKLKGAFENGKIYEEAAIDKRSAELFYNGQVFEIIESIKESPRIGSEVSIEGNTYVISEQPKERIYKPYTSILVSPVTFQFLVPADKALDVVNKIQDRYQREMGKVRNRLPLDVGIVFFKRKTPLYVAVDTARRMLMMRRSNYDAEEWMVIEQPQVTGGKVHLVLKTAHEQRIEWEIGYELGDTRADFYHPHFIVTGYDSDRLPEERPTYFFVPKLGDLVHVKELCKGDRVKIVPNYFDFEFLDSCTRRYDMNYEVDRSTNEKVKRSHPISGKNGPRPYYLDELSSFAGIWWMLSGHGDYKLADSSSWKGLTISQIKGLEAVLSERIAIWKPETLTSGFVKAVLTNTFGQVWAKFIETDQEAMQKACISGQLFDVIELYIRLSGKTTSQEEKE